MIEGSILKQEYTGEIDFSAMIEDNEEYVEKTLEIKEREKIMPQVELTCL